MTLGQFLRTFAFGHVRQLDAVASRTLAGLVKVVPQVRAWATTSEGIAFVDIDDTVREAHGSRKQGVQNGYNRVKGLNAQVVTVSSSPRPAHCRRPACARGNWSPDTAAPRCCPRRSRRPGPRELALTVDSQEAA